MFGQMQPGAVANDCTTGEQFIQQADEGRTLQRQGGKAAQPIPVGAELIGLLLMQVRQLL
ncbi:hypothetical protein D3C75_1356720 [compost metagenome]